jgi:hypothetical protein
MEKRRERWRREEKMLAASKRRQIMLSATKSDPHFAHCRFVDSEVRKEWATLGKAYTDLKDKLDDHMARQRLNAAIALRF